MSFQSCHVGRTSRELWYKSSCELAQVQKSWHKPRSDKQKMPSMAAVKSFPVLDQGDHGHREHGRTKGQSSGLALLRHCSEPQPGEELRRSHPSHRTDGRHHAHCLADNGRRTKATKDHSLSPPHRGRDLAGLLAQQIESAGRRFHLDAELDAKKGASRD